MSAKFSLVIGEMSSIPNGQGGFELRQLYLADAGGVVVKRNGVEVSRVVRAEAGDPGSVDRFADQQPEMVGNAAAEIPTIETLAGAEVTIYGGLFGDEPVDP